MNEFQKFLCMVDGDEKKTVLFLIYDFWKKWSKNDRSQKKFFIPKSVCSYISTAQKIF